MLRTFFCLGLFVASSSLLHCGGLTGDSPLHPGADGGATSDGGSPDASTADASDGSCDGAASTYHGPPSSPPPGHRATATACKASSYPGAADGGQGPACSTDADCATAAGTHCRDHACSTDACLADSDCATGEACGCVADGAGRWTGGNVCVAVDCHVDADCTAGNYCVPSGNYCGDLSGYYCTQATDECVAAADCPCGETLCAYAPMVGYRVCSSGTCMGKGRGAP